MKPQIITIGLVDEFPALRKGLALLLNQTENFKVTLQAGSAHELKEALQKKGSPDVLLLDLRPPEMNGMEAMQWLNSDFSELKTVIYTNCNVDLTVIKLYRLGTRAILPKKVSDTELVRAIQQVSEEGYYYNDVFSRKLLLQLTTGDRRDTKHLKPVLTEKEESFLKLVLAHKTYKEIAAELGTSEGMVDKIRNGLFEKLEVQSKEAMAVKAKDN